MLAPWRMRSATRCHGPAMALAAPDTGEPHPSSLGSLKRRQDVYE